MTHVCRAKNEARRFEEHKCTGDCLEAVGFPVEGIVLIDRMIDFQPGDLVWCTKCAGSINSYIKQVQVVGADVIVGTRYRDPARDFTFNAEEILGVVVRCFDEDRNVLWERGAVNE